MEFFPKVDPVQIQPLDLADIRKSNVQNAMAQVGLQDMQEQLMARKAMGDWINQNGGLPQTPDQVQQLAISLSSRGLPLDKAFDMAGKAQAFGMNNLKMGLYRGVTDALGGGGQQPQQPPMSQGQTPQMGQTPPVPGSGNGAMGGMPTPPQGGASALAPATGGNSSLMADMTAAAQQAGVPDLAPALSRFVVAESGGNPYAQAGTSSAKGLGQFTGGTRQYIMNKYGVDAWSQDPQQQKLALAYLAKESRTKLAQDMGVQEAQITPAQLYMSHLLGQGGAPKFLKALSTNPDAPALQFVAPQSVQANSGIFFDKQNQPRSVQQVFNLLGAKVDGGQPAQGPVQGSGAQMPGQQLQAPMAGAANSPMFQKIQAIIKANPASLMLPEFEGLVKGALAVEGFRTPEQQAQINLWLEQQKKGLEAQYAGQIAGAQEMGKGRASIQLENEGGAPVSPQGQAMAAGLKAGAEAGAKLGPAVSQKAIDQIIDEQKAARDTLDQITQRKGRLVKAAESPVSGAAVPFMTSVAPILDAIVPEGASGWIAKKNSELQQKGMQGAELQKALAQETANMIAQNVGLHRGGEWAMELAKSANPQSSMTAAQRNQIISDINEQLDMQAKSAQDLLNHSTNTDADMLNKRALERNSSALQTYGERIGKALQTATAPLQQQASAQGGQPSPGVKFSSLDSLKTAVSRGDINANQAREIARANGWVR